MREGNHLCNKKRYLLYLGSKKRYSQHLMCVSSAEIVKGSHMTRAQWQWEADWCKPINIKGTTLQITSRGALGEVDAGWFEANIWELCLKFRNNSQVKTACFRFLLYQNFQRELNSLNVRHTKCVYDFFVTFMTQLKAWLGYVFKDKTWRFASVSHLVISVDLCWELFRV